MKFNIIILLCFLFIPTLQDKKGLCEKLLTQANSFDDIEKAIPIIKKQENVFKFVPSIHPIANKNNPRITSNFGYRIDPISKEKNKFHSGIDFVAEYATTIHATADGKISFVGNKSGYGKCVIIEHNYGFKTLYAHLTEIYAWNNRQIKKGDIIGFLGSTGKSTGPHLHYEIIKNENKINPKSFLQI